MATHDRDSNDPLRKTEPIDVPSCAGCGRALENKVEKFCLACRERMDREKLVDR